MADLTVVSYDLNGKKLSFADWVSNLSPTETPFISMTGKESVSQTLFQWQTDVLAQASDSNAVVEGAEADSNVLIPTFKHSNITQILRKVVMVSDTATKLANYGRSNETKYQLEKAGKEIKRDLEVILLSDQTRIDGDPISIPRRTAAFRSLVAPYDLPDPTTGATVHKAMAANSPTEAEIFDMTYNLYLSGSDADIIMFHPTFANFFSSLMEVSPSNGRIKLFSGDDVKFNHYVTEVVDPLGRPYKLLPNRWMPKDAIYFLNAKSWTQMVLREPNRSVLAKDGSYTKWLLEMEVGLRHKHPYASGVLLTRDAAPEPIQVTITIDEPFTFDVSDAPIDVTQYVTITPAEAAARGAVYTIDYSGTSGLSITPQGAISANQAGDGIFRIVPLANPNNWKNVYTQVTDRNAPVVPVESISLDKQFGYGGVGNLIARGASDTSNAVTNVGDSFTVNILPATAPQEFTVENDNPTVASIAVVGNVLNFTALTGGNCVFRVKSVQDPTKVYEGGFYVYSSAVDVAGFMSNPMYPGEVQDLIAVISPEPPVPQWTYVSLDPAVATVNFAKKVTAVAPGFTRIRAIASINGVKFFDQSGLDVDPIVLAITPNSFTLEEGAALDIDTYVTCTPNSAFTGGVTYAITSGSAFADVDPLTGIIHANAAGTAVIEVTLVNKPTEKASATIVITPAGAPAVTSVTLNSPNYYGGVGSRVLQMGAALTSDAVSATITPATVTILPAGAPQGFTAVSSAPGVATVAIVGNQVNITAVSFGTTTLTITSTADGTKQATAVVNIYDHSVSTESYSPSTINVGETSQLVYSVDTPTPAPTWHFATLDTAVATIDATGLTTGVGDGFTRGRAIADINGVRFYDQSGITVNAVI